MTKWCSSISIELVALAEPPDKLINLDGKSL